MGQKEVSNSEHIRNMALKDILDQLPEKRRKVYEVISKWEPISNERIAEHLGWPLHTVTPRTGELREIGLIEWAGDSVSIHSKKKVSLWRLNRNGTQLGLF